MVTQPRSGETGIERLTSGDNGSSSLSFLAPSQSSPEAMNSWAEQPQPENLLPQMPVLNCHHWGPILLAAGFSCSHTASYWGEPFV